MSSTECFACIHIHSQLLIGNCRFRLITMCYSAVYLSVKFDYKYWNLSVLFNMETPQNSGVLAVKSEKRHVTLWHYKFGLWINQCLIRFFVNYFQFSLRDQSRLQFNKMADWSGLGHVTGLTLVHCLSRFANNVPRCVWGEAPPPRFIPDTYLPRVLPASSKTQTGLDLNKC